LNRSSRLTRNDDIKHVRMEGLSIAHETIVLGFLQNQTEKNKVAVIAGRSIGGAVQRNYAKRRLRSAYQHFQSALQQGYDIVLIARKPILERDYQTFLIELKSLLEQAGLMKANVR